MKSRVLKAPAVRLAPDPRAVARDAELARRRHDELEVARAQGRDDAVTEGAAMLPAVLDAVRAAAADVSGAVQERRTDDVLAVIEVAVEVARWILQRELSTVPEAIADRVRAALADLPDDTPAIVRVHPTAAVLLAEVEGVTVVGDPAVAPGDAQIDAGPTHVDLSQEQALQLAVAALQGSS